MQFIQKRVQNALDDGEMQRVATPEETKFKFFHLITAVILLAVALLVTIVLILTTIHTKQYASTLSLFPANIEYDGDESYGSYKSANLTNPNIGAVDINMNWASVEPQQGVYDFAPADSEMAAWAAQGKKFTIVMRFIYERQQPCSGEQALPGWELARIPSFCSAKGDSIPDYFNATFQSDFQAYVTAVAQHIAAGPYKNNLAYVRVGVGAAGESYPCLGCNSANMQQLSAWGYSIPAWVTWQETMLAAYKNSFSFAPVVYPLGDNDIDPMTNVPVSKEVGYWAGAHGLGVGQEGLANTSGYANGQAVQIAKYVRSTYPSAYIQFQTNTAVSSAADVQGDIKIASSAGAFSIEWYAADTVNPSYQSYFHQWQQTVDSTTAGLMGTPSVAETLTPTLTTPTEPTPAPTLTLTPTPSPQSNILGVDTFQRPNQPFWGTATDGHVWGADANTSKSFAISGNDGKITPGAPANLTAILGPAAANEEILLNGLMSTIASNNTLGVVARYSTPGNYYKAAINGSSLFLQKSVNGSLTNLKSVPFSAKANTSYAIRFRAEGSTLSAKAWQTGSAEPASWMVTTTDTKFPSGNCGIRTYQQGNVTTLISSFQAAQF